MARPVDGGGALAQEFGLAKPVLACCAIHPTLSLVIEKNLPSPPAPDSAIIAGIAVPPISHARFAIGDVVRHRIFEFRGVVFDIDPVFANSEEWYESIPQDMRPAKDQPFYHLFAENDEGSYVAYVSQQNLVRDDSDEQIEHPAIAGLFDGFVDGRYHLRREHRH
ncbi:heat shock protein HspQ [Sphingomonas crocodyli]|uniref:Heat shock protein HspQ n=1 Tax=Sphingomonas crocodyli TaxID=1979270 RepID=A0A437M6H5_9SPHN|nr:heat shock protein HspQ [Sphingomonas crocodyli]